MLNKIDRFDGDYAFLSNFYSCDVSYQGLTYRNSEAAFQAAKCADEAGKAAFTGLDPSQAKRVGRRVALRPDWEDIKDRVMLEVVSAKFAQHPDLAGKLVATGDAELVEGNTWHDTYWGVCGGTGQNKLGQILMAVRAKLVLNAAYGTGPRASFRFDGSTGTADHEDHSGVFPCPLRTVGAHRPELP